MASNGDDGAGPGDPTAEGSAADGGVVDRWTALDRGWQALALGLVIVAAHLVGQAL
ncbi:MULTISPECIES: hypothetical protein [Halorubrum]|uniref:Uncharacterized protein n=1 Tax=Halorubrum hochstenium ATCC 700873 TaxID=1227481 RepID=M0FLE4_9EURY|nr:MULTISPECIES: hypothetical protein [Halorubrum]ELZ59404.1 hypothetical protein C467_03991 [Halorubrum hochstenium ATCC 700873]